MVIYRVHGFWMGHFCTVWSTETEEQFEAYCKEQGFEKDDKGIYRTIDAFIEIKQEQKEET